MNEQARHMAAAAGSSIPPLLKLRAVAKSFAGVPALKGVDFDVAAGEVHAIVGENGAGKSTLIAIASGVLPMDAGEISFAGDVVAAPRPRRMRELGVSAAFQHPALAADLTVLENLQLVAKNLSGRQGAAEALRLIRSVATEQLDMALDARVGDLTLAQRYVVEIARAMSTRPKVLFLDEPTEPFQHADIRKLFALINAVRDRGVAIIYVSHRLREVTELADRISVLRDGEVVDSGPARAFSIGDIVARIAGRPVGQMFPAKSRKIGEPLLEVRNLSGNRFDAIDLVVRAGEIVGLAGVEGEGQREFLRTVAGVDRRRAGEIRVAGRHLRHDGPDAARAAGAGFVSNDRRAEGLFASLSVRENISLGLLGKIADYGIVDRAAENKLCARIAEQLRVRTASLEAPIETLSGGNQQKVLFGREIAAGPKVLLVDEPTSGVDVGARVEIYQRLRAIADQGLAVVASSSDGVELEGLCDRVCIFARGKIVRELTNADVTDEEITKANLSATIARSGAVAPRTRAIDRRIFAGDRFPAAILVAVIAFVLLGTQLANGYFLSAFNLRQMLTLLSILCFVSMGQLMTMLVGAVDLSVGPLVGFCVVLCSFWVPQGGDTFLLLGGVIAVVAFCTVFGFLQGQLVSSMGLPSVVVTLASFMGLQGLSLLLRPHPAGEIDDFLSDAFRAPVLGVPLAFVAVLAAAAALEWFLHRCDAGRKIRAIGSNPDAADRLGLDRRRIMLLAFAMSGGLAGVAGVMEAAQIGIGSGTTGVDFTLLSITAVVLGGASVAGGRGSMMCTLLGSALVQATISASSFLKADTSIQLVAIGLITVIAAGSFRVARGFGVADSG